MSNDISAVVNASGIPDYMRRSVIGYVTEGWKPGDFLRAILANDLREAIGRADPNNAATVTDYAELLTQLPHGCHGSYEAVDAWCARGGIGLPPSEVQTRDAQHVIYCFNNGGSPGWYSAVAIGDDGHQIAGHCCSSEGYMAHDLGLTSEWKHDAYNKHFGEGNWRLEWVPRDQLDSHEGFRTALALSAALHEAGQSGESEHAELPSIEVVVSESQ